jgi:hypothetical protein
VGADIIPPNFVDSIALNMYHDGSEGLQASSHGCAVNTFWGRRDWYAGVPAGGYGMQPLCRSLP